MAGPYSILGEMHFVTKQWKAAPFVHFWNVQCMSFLHISMRAEICEKNVAPDTSICHVTNCKILWQWCRHVQEKEQKCNFMWLGRMLMTNCTFTSSDIWSQKLSGRSVISTLGTECLAFSWWLCLSISFVYVGHKPDQNYLAAWYGATTVAPPPVEGSLIIISRQCPWLY